jgi:uncharacterized protein
MLIDGVLRTMYYSVEAVEKYRRAWHQHAEETKRKNESRRQDALQCAKTLTKMLVSRFVANKVMLFGSILKEDRFNKNSDIDIAVEGIDAEKYFSAFAECQMLDFPVDLIMDFNQNPSTTLSPPAIPSFIVSNKRRLPMLRILDSLKLRAYFADIFNIAQEIHAGIE